MIGLSVILYFIQTVCFIEQIRAHGYLADPPARSSAWLYDKDFQECCRYYNHIEMSCGGTFHQWTVNGGKCSICGEANDLEPKLLGVGDAMYLGKIVRTYTQGAIIPVTVVLTANHKGVFEFRVCSVDNDSASDATQACLNLNVLNVTNDSKLPDGTNSPTQYLVNQTSTTVHINVTLPSDLVCKHCVFQWKYRTGNSWGVSNGRGCVGCGKANEEFYGCSDIAIVSEVTTASTTATNQPTTTQAPSTTITKELTTTTAVSRKCTIAIIFSESFDISSIMNQYCQTICPNNCASDNMLGNEMLYNGCINGCNKLCACE